ncbi:hypothetical protein CEUSTIGMA_g11121.t1 [Chlamydomonas eustigma]|uniref:BLUF domain-containing protein n=1 Tax=Chlamydomonas eustigma TaxID=1157962 RepID=A0A250XKZ3_9CHLO|nr:hypothetical protein CEUSTIGMA_g11121.t1 [Chlamydomonas eustigma]|eukprot:GAX83696.1 hypothetical protein CEUSTIGMA_g11121.t1 [Chlamydomonas eustigma]
MAEVERSDLDAKRENLLDVVLDKLHKAGKTIIFSRIIYVARFSRREQQIDSMKAFHEQLVEKHDPGNEISGMLLVYPACMMHMLEGRTSTLLAYLKDVISATPSESNIAETRVISSTEDIPSRCYHGWFSSFINTVSSVDTMDPCDSTTIVKNATELNVYLRKVGQSLQGQSESEIKRRLASLDSYVEGTPAPEVVLSLTPAEDAPSIPEYLDIFSGPVNVDLDVESVWPMPNPLKF